MAGLITVITLSGCAASRQTVEGTGSDRNVNMQQAAQHADEVISDTLNAIKPTISWTHGESTDGTCNSVKDDAKGTGTVTRRAAVMTAISATQRGKIVKAVKQQWKDKGYVITATRDSSESPAIFATTSKNFRLALEVGYKGQAFLDVVTPCVKQSQVVPPKTKPNGPDYSGGKIPTPNVQSDFWSKRPSA
ncbi:MULTISPECIES: hypothetical protein [Streptomyces]|uniref:hypothetical protein n=1 Tax=Streptomyces TaxID=1883 RepID=UPI001FCF80E7|nr:hypothetical protein [Streptomyces kasugaensis]